MKYFNPDKSSYVYNTRMNCMLKTITEEELYEKARKHKLWLIGHKEGQKGNFSLLKFPENYNFNYRDLREAIFDKSEMRGVSFKGCDLRNCSFKGAVVISSFFSGANVSGTSFFQCDLRDSDYESALNIKEADLQSANLRKSDKQFKYKVQSAAPNGDKYIYFADNIKDLLKLLFKRKLLDRDKYQDLRRMVRLRKNGVTYYEFIKENGNFSKKKCSEFLNKGEDLSEKEELLLIQDVVRYENNYTQLQKFKENEGRYVDIV